MLGKPIRQLVVMLAAVIFTLSSFSASAYKVYLSPANHGGQNIGCRGLNEDVTARSFALYAAAELASKGYTVRVGSGGAQDNTNNSNSWGSNLHIPIHSNGGPGGLSCWGTMPNLFGGTEGLYYSSNGSRLVRNLLDLIAPVSPGTSDKAERRTDLIELNSTRMVAGYLEVERHTWNQGADWLLDSSRYSAYRVRIAVDRYRAGNFGGGGGGW